MRPNKEWAILGTACVVSCGIGAAISHIWTKRRIKSEPEEQIKATQLELDFKKAEQEKDFNWKIQQLNHVMGKFTDAMQQAHNVVDQFQDTGEVYLGNFTEKFIRQENNEEETVMNVIEQEDPPIENVFTGIDEDWNYDLEIPSRNPEIPYTCHRDEYFEEMEQNNLGHSHSVLTYYRGDAILCDELDSPIYDPERVVGKLEFGKGSQDPNVVYIRNEKLMADYEVLLDPGYYQVEVLGQQVENGLSKDDLKHSVQKFRFE